MKFDYAEKGMKRKIIVFESIEGSFFERMMNIMDFLGLAVKNGDKHWLSRNKYIEIFVLMRIIYSQEGNYTQNKIVYLSIPVI